MVGYSLRDIGKEIRVMDGDLAHSDRGGGFDSFGRIGFFVWGEGLW